MDTVGWMRWNGPPHCCSCLPYAQTGVRYGVVMQEEIVFIFLFALALRIRCFNFLSVLTYRCELFVAPLFNNSTNKIHRLPQKTLATILSVEVCTSSFLVRRLLTMPRHLSLGLSPAIIFDRKSSPSFSLRWWSFAHVFCGCFVFDGVHSRHSHSSDGGHSLRFSNRCYGAQFTCPDVPSSRISTSTFPLVSVYAVVAVRPLWGLSPASFSTVLKRRTPCLS
jgi:hypothetical protein